MSNDRIFSHNNVSSAFITDGNLSVSSDSESENESVPIVPPSKPVPLRLRGRAFVIRPGFVRHSNALRLRGSATLRTSVSTPPRAEESDTTRSPVLAPLRLTGTVTPRVSVPASLALGGTATRRPVNYRFWSERETGKSIYKFTLFALLQEGEVVPFTFTSERRPLVPSHWYSRENPAYPFYPDSRDSRISNSFRSTENRNVKVVIVKGVHKNEHGVIVKSYVRRKSAHKVLTADGAVTTIKQVNLRRLDRQFWLPFGFPVNEEF